MHKGIILLVKANHKIGAKQRAEEFLENFKGDVWDWYQIGGRWTGVLDNYNPDKDPKNIEICWLCQGTGKRNDAIGEQAREKNPNFTCNGCDGKGERVKWPTQFAEHDNNILSLKDCLKIVKKWQQDPIKAGKKELEKADKWKKEKNWSMYGYILKCAGKIFQQEFSFEANVFNTEQYDFSLPKDIKNYFGVIIDIHN